MERFNGLVTMGVIPWSQGSLCVCVCVCVWQGEVKVEMEASLLLKVG